MTIGIFIGISGTVFALTDGKFSDVDYSGYYAKSLERMVDMDVVSGYQNGTFGPNDSVTRAQMVTILDRYDQNKIEQLSILACKAFENTKTSNYTLEESKLLLNLCE